MIYAFLAPGFEEIEAVTVIDMLRRAELPVKTVGIGGITVTGAHQIPVVCDCGDGGLTPAADLTAVFLPGGMPGTRNLEQSPVVQRFLDYAAENGRFLCAICAAPLILGHKNLLRGKRAVCFPGFEPDLYGALRCSEPVCRDGTVITGKGPGVTLEFALAMIAALKSEAAALQIKESMQCPSRE